MASTSTTSEGGAAAGAAVESTWEVKAGLAKMLKGGVIMDVTSPAEARIAEEAGAVAVMALERIPADIRRDGGVARMSDPDMIDSIKACVTIPVMAKSRIGHFVESQMLQAMGVDFIDESEVLTMADDCHHTNKHKFAAPFVCGCKCLGEALRRIAEGAAMLRTKGEAGTGNIVEAVRHARAVNGAIKQLGSMDEVRPTVIPLAMTYQTHSPCTRFCSPTQPNPPNQDEFYVFAKEHRVPVALVKQVAAEGQLPVVNFAAGGVATPADCALMMQLGMDGVFVGSGIFKSGNPAKRARACVMATTHFNDPKVLVDVSRDLGEAMVGITDLDKQPVNFRDRDE